MLVVLLAGYANAQTKTPVKVADLKKEITSHIAKSHPGYIVKEAFKVEKNKVVTFEVKAQKDATKITLIYDEKGAFVKSETPKPTTNQTGTQNKTTPNPSVKTGSGSSTK